MEKQKIENKIEKLNELISYLDEGQNRVSPWEGNLIVLECLKLILEIMNERKF